MKKNKLLSGLFCLLFLIQGTIHAQDPVAVCAANQRKVIKLLSQEILSDQEKTKIYNLVKPCADKGDINAICNLGILYKDGIGVEQDYNKAIGYFEKSAAEGHSKAIYALGYFYLKGLGDLKQSYENAVKLFEESADPMGLHWLSFCKYFGYGIAQNKSEAVDLLYNNIIINSETLAEQFEIEMEPTTGELSSQYNDVPEKFKSIANYGQLQTTINNSQFLPPAVSGTYAGHFAEYDWSGEQVIRYIPFEIEADVLDDNGNINIIMTVFGDIVQANAKWENGILYFEDLQFDLPRLYTDHPDHTTLKYNLNKIVFQPVPHDGVNYLIGTLDATIVNWSEPSNPMIVIINQTSKTEDNILISELQKQNNVIKVYPNPFQIGFTVGYELPADGEVGISISNLTNTISQEVFSASQVSGFHTFSISSFPFPSGTYLVWLSINGTLNSRTIIKQ